MLNETIQSQSPKVNSHLPPPTHTHKQFQIHHFFTNNPSIKISFLSSIICHTFSKLSNLKMKNNLFHQPPHNPQAEGPTIINFDTNCQEIRGKTKVERSIVPKNHNKRQQQNIYYYTNTVVGNLVTLPPPKKFLSLM